METWRSGRSLRNLVTRFGGARHCLWVTVADGALHVAPHFPFNLMFLPAVCGLWHEVPGGAIRVVEWRDGPLGRRRVAVRFAVPDGPDEVIEVSLRDPDAFGRALEDTRRVDS